jgi:hypothetical protein
MDASELDVPLASVHGTADNVVTYNRGLVNPGVPLMYLDGSRMLHERACAINLENQLYTFNGAGHVPYIGTSGTAQAYMDTTVNFYRDFLIQQMGCTQAPLQLANAWAQTANLYAAEYCDGSPVNETCALVNIADESLNDWMLYPNPSTNQVHVKLPSESAMTIVITDLSGRVVYQQKHQTDHAVIDVSVFTAGNYLVQVISDAGAMLTKKLFVN